MEQLTKNQAVATSQEAVQNQNEPQLRDENAHNDKSVHGVLNPTYQAGLRRDAVQPDIEAERKKRDEIEAGKSYCSRRFGGATCDDKSAQIYRSEERFSRNAETDLVCRLLLEKKKIRTQKASAFNRPTDERFLISCELHVHMSSATGATMALSTATPQ